MISIAGQIILTAAQTRAAEAASGVDPAVLMQRAGRGIADALRRLSAGSEMLILCGPGNNGGDGYVAARLLREAGCAVRVAASDAPRSELGIAARKAWAGAVEVLADAMPAPILVDALFGIGLTRALDDDVATAFRRLAADARLTIAIDLPSGIATDDGTILTPPPAIAVTLALGCVKPSLLLQPAAAACGAIRLIDIGLQPSGTAQVIAPPSLPKPGPTSHKYSRGMVAVVSGVMAGAGEMAATAAIRAGAGYVLLLTDRPGEPHAVVRRTFAPDALTDERIGAVVIGPGLGRDDAACARLDAAFASGRPLVIDGDALHLVDSARIARHHAPVILTPHGGEFTALFGKGSGSKIDRTRAAAAAAYAIVVHKGADTVIAAPDGRVRVAGDASDWLSTAGTGDVLAGTIGAMMASGLGPFTAASAGVWLHGDAARRAGAALIADDLLHHLTAARAAL